MSKIVFIRREMLNAAIIGIDPQNKKTQSLVSKWANLSLNKRFNTSSRRRKGKPQMGSITFNNLILQKL